MNKIAFITNSSLNNNIKAASATKRLKKERFWV